MYVDGPLTSGFKQVPEEFTSGLTSPLMTPTLLTNTASYGLH